MADQVLNKLRERGDEANYRIFLVRETLTYITSYFERHAKAEEEYMRKIGYTGYTLHKMLHDEFCNIQLKKYQDIVKRGECSKKRYKIYRKRNWMAIGAYSNSRYGDHRKGYSSRACKEE